MLYFPSNSPKYLHRETAPVFMTAPGSRITQPAFLHQKRPSLWCHTVQRAAPVARSNGTA